MTLGTSAVGPKPTCELSDECLMLGVKQTPKIRAVTSACDPQRHFLAVN
jgi:hypothetical protein